MKPEQKFFEAIESIAFNKDHRERIGSSLLANRLLVKQAKLFYSDIELARTRAAFIKSKTLDNLDKYLIEFESNFTKKGGKVIWAKDNEEALSEIYKLIEKRATKKILKNRSTLFEEIELNTSLENKKIEISECDFGNYIQTLAGEKAYHPVFPTLNQTKNTTIEILKKKHEVDLGATAQDLSDLINESISNEFGSTNIAVTGANLLIADSGSVVVFENEACVANLAALPKTHIVIVGIEEIIPALNDLDLFLHLFSTYSNGAANNTYTHLISGPRQNEEIDGPDEMFVVLLDNGRSEVLTQISQRSALACIKCGACYAVCPVYKSIGGHAYQSVYNGPIGSILTPLLKGMEEYKFLSFASPSAMESKEECPVKIDFPKLLQHNRTDSIKICPPGKTEKLSLFFWKTAMLRRNSMDKGGAKLKNFMLRQFFKKSWGERREIPGVAPKSFNQIWKERKGIK